MCLRQSGLLEKELYGAYPLPSNRIWSGVPWLVEHALVVVRVYLRVYWSRPVGDVAPGYERSWSELVHSQLFANDEKCGRLHRNDPHAGRAMRRRATHLGYWWQVTMLQWPQHDVFCHGDERDVATVFISAGTWCFFDLATWGPVIWGLRSPESPDCARWRPESPDRARWEEAFHAESVLQDNQKAMGKLPLGATDSAIPLYASIKGSLVVENLSRDYAPWACFVHRYWP